MQNGVVASWECGRVFAVIQQACYLAVIKPTVQDAFAISHRLLRLKCLMATSLLQVVNRLDASDSQDFLSTSLMQVISGTRSKSDFHLDEANRLDETT